MSLKGGLLSYYNLNGNVLDSKGSNNGTATDISYVSGLKGQAVNFSQSSSKIVCSPFTLTNQLTIQAWIYVNSSNRAIILSEYSTGANNDVFYISLNDNKLNDVTFVVISANGDFGSNGGSISSAFQFTTWTHLVCTFDGTQLGNAGRCKIFINGVQKTLTFTGTIGSALNPNTFDFWIGSLVGNPSLTFFGYMDEIGIWNRALSPAEITQLYNSGRGLSYPFSNSSNFFPFFK